MYGYGYSYRILASLMLFGLFILLDHRSSNSKKLLFTEIKDSQFNLYDFSFRKVHSLQIVINRWFFNRRKTFA